MIKYEGKEYRNLQEQVQKNMEDIDLIKGYKGYLGPFETTSDIPESQYSQYWLYLVGTTVPYEMYKYNGSTFVGLGPFNVQGPKGDKGETGGPGPVGPEGVGIASIVKTGTSGLVDTYTITLTNGQTSTFTVTNGAQGPEGKKEIYKHTIQILRNDTTEKTNLFAIFEAYNYSNLPINTIQKLCNAVSNPPSGEILMSNTSIVNGHYYEDTGINPQKSSTIEKIYIQSSGIRFTMGLFFNGASNTSVEILVDDEIIIVTDVVTHIHLN